MVSQRFSKMRHLWKGKDPHLNLRMRLYKATVCSVLTCDSEAWILTEEVCVMCKTINEANAVMLAIITDKTVNQEA